MTDIKVTLSLDVAGAKSTVVVPTLTVAAVDRVAVVLPKAVNGSALMEHTVKAAPDGATLSLVVITASAYERAGSGVRILRASGDVDGLALESPIYLAGDSLFAAIPLAADALLLVNDSTSKDITVDILVGRAAE